MLKKKDLRKSARSAGLKTPMAESYSRPNEQLNKMTIAERKAPFQFSENPNEWDARLFYDLCVRDSLMDHIQKWRLTLAASPPVLTYRR